ncbi:2'-5'-oligoadenylate synthase-like protein 2 [Amblyraja radiata]|uniref:2'-5'-oligoadenylate synthase-like protein 2 n=1 Tax=Amblyraja radiata TaxID=386614 RepID=UPI001402C06A|nr:2'-5'-oligoadenylate synthase-like protein 2 [Amblyraja radiata]
MKDAVNRICEFLKNQCFMNQPNISVIRAVKGGSSGKGTALRNSSDADLVVFLSCFKSFQDQRANRQEILEEIRKMLEKCSRSLAYEIHDIQITIGSSNNPPKSMSFILQSKKSSESVEFDVLPTYDALTPQCNFSVAHLKLINFVNENKVMDGEFSPCFTELQREFVKRHPAKVKDLIRLLKYWYKEYVKPRKSELCGARLPEKYAVELLTVYAWEQGNHQERFDTAQGFRTVLDLICRYQEVCIYWTKFYDVNNPTVADFLIRKLHGKGPFILDPADPTGNVASSGGWNVMQDEARKCLSMPCVMNTPAWDVQPVKTFKITVTSLDGKSLQQKADINFKVSEIKRNIHQNWKISVSQQQLVFNGTILDDGKTLLGSRIFFDATIQLMPNTMEIFVKYNEHVTLLNRNSGRTQVNRNQRRLKTSFPVGLTSTRKQSLCTVKKRIMDLYQTQARNLDTFIYLHLQPDENFLRLVAETIDKICTFLKGQCPYKISKTVKGGSLGKGTAVKNGSDADMVVFLNYFKCFDDQKKNRAEILSNIRELLLKYEKNIGHQIKMSQPRIIPALSSPRSLNLLFKSTESSDFVEVDVLPAFDALGPLTSTGVKNQVYEGLIATGERGGEFSTCFTELQRDFIKTRPTKLKSLIRLVKYWYTEKVRRPCKGQLRTGEYLPPKYALELLIIYAWESAEKGVNFNTAEGFRTVLELIVQYKDLWIFWTTNYNFDSDNIGRFLKNKLKEPKPMILDPADPTGNVAAAARWDLVAEEAKRCLQQNCVQNVNSWNVKPVMTFEITVTSLDGKSLLLTANINLKVSEIKRNIDQNWTIPVSQQRLVFNGTILDDGKTLLDSSIFFDATVKLLMLNTMDIFVNYNGRNLTIQVSPSDKVSSLKNEIESRTHVQPRQYYLTFQSHQLEDERTLQSYGIKKLSTIMVNLRLRGGNELQCFNAENHS